MCLRSHKPQTLVDKCPEHNPRSVIDNDRS